MTSPVLGARGYAGDHGTADPMLDEGTAGLGYFRIWLPLYHRAELAGTGSNMTAVEAQRRYDEQRGMNFLSLEQDADLLRDAAERLRSPRAELSRHVRSIGPGWRGAGGTAALDHLERLERAASDVCDRMAELPAVLADAATELRAQVQTKVDWVSTLDPSTICGCSRGTVERVVAVSSTPPSSGAADADILVLASTAPFAGTLGASAADLEPRNRRLMIDACRDFLSDVFAPTVERQWDQYVRLCDDVHDGCLGVYAVVADALSAVRFPDAPGAASAAATGTATPPAAVHSTSADGGRADPGPTGAGHSDAGPNEQPAHHTVGHADDPGTAGTGAALASAVDAPVDTGAHLAGTGPHPPDAAVAGVVPRWPGGLLDLSGSHPADAWNVADDAFTVGSHTWASVGSILGDPVPADPSGADGPGAPVVEGPAPPGRAPRHPERAHGR